MFFGCVKDGLVTLDQRPALVDACLRHGIVDIRPWRAREFGLRTVKLDDAGNEFDVVECDMDGRIADAAFSGALNKALLPLCKGLAGRAFGAVRFGGFGGWLGGGGWRGRCGQLAYRCGCGRRSGR
ncbi:hypothetical protein SDC9_92607 [bioreactor metagenome]|uniref:Uncharacterized protein n=1 Tax=bioreactor metagenome TaxID=1076179 RepID=A0A644ZY95_9ZZZZ